LKHPKHHHYFQISKKHTSSVTLTTNDGVTNNGFAKTQISATDVTIDGSNAATAGSVADRLKEISSYVSAKFLLLKFVYTI
jgi:hypothetical protein